MDVLCRRRWAKAVCRIKATHWRIKGVRGVGMCASQKTVDFTQGQRGADAADIEGERRV